MVAHAQDVNPMRNAALLSTLVIATAIFASAMPTATAQALPARFLVNLNVLPNETALFHDAKIVATNAAISTLLVEPRHPVAFEALLREDPNVASYETDRVAYRTDAVGKDPRLARDQYDLQPDTTNLVQAWTQTTGSTAVKVCVVDTGQYRTHSDLKAAAWAEWKDFVNGRTTPYDDNGHGTHVTGTIGAVFNNKKGIAGIAQVSLAGAKVLSGSGSGTISAVANGITWCADIGAHIISMSLGGSRSTTMARAVTYATKKGLLVVAAAGNDGPCKNCVNYPAAYADAMAVSCTDRGNHLCDFSSQGPQVDIAAPGLDILSTVPPGKFGCSSKSTACYKKLSGTSMSTPHVAGLAALVKSAHPTFTAAQIRNQIQSTALDLGAPGQDVEFGAGLMRGEAV